MNCKRALAICAAIFLITLIVVGPARLMLLQRRYQILNHANIPAIQTWARALPKSALVQTFKESDWPDSIKVLEPAHVTMDRDVVLLHYSRSGFYSITFYIGIDQPPDLAYLQNYPHYQIDKDAILYFHD